MSRAHFREHIQAANGLAVRVLVGATVDVYTTGTVTPTPLTLWSAASGGVALTNPLTADATGQVEFYLDTDERLDLLIAATGYAPQTVTVDVVAQQTDTADDRVGGTTTAQTKLGIRSTGAAFDLVLASSEVLTAERTLSLVVGDASPTLTLPVSGTLATTADVAVASGSAAVVATNLATHAALTAAHGATGAVVGTTNAQALTNKTLTSPVVGTRLSFSDAVSMIVPGATSFSLRNNADSADNLLITNAGAVTVRSGLVVTASGLTITAGNIGIGAATGTDVGVLVSGASLTTGTNQYAFYTNVTFGASATTSMNGLRVAVATPAASITVVDGRGVFVRTPTIGAASAITTNRGVHVENQGASGVTNAYGLFVEDQTGAATINRAIHVAGGDVVLAGGGALATNATKGFTFLPSCAGAATGTPGSIPTAAVPIVIDSTNFKLYAYIGGAWKSVTLT